MFSRGGGNAPKSAEYFTPVHTANDSSETEVIRVIYVCLALFFCKSTEKDNEEIRRRIRRLKTEMMIRLQECWEEELEEEEGEVPLCVKPGCCSSSLQYL